MKRKLLIASLVVLTLGFTGCGAQSSESSKTTIIDEVTLYETTADEVHEMWDKKNLVYQDYYTTVSDSFLGYDCYYEIYTHNDDDIIDGVRINILFHDDEEVKQGNNEITNYLKKKLIAGYDDAVRYEFEDGEEIEYLYPIDSVEVDGETNYICVELVKSYAQSEDYLPEGYSSNYFEVSYFRVTKDYFKSYYEGDTEFSVDSDASADASTSDASASESTEETSEVTDYRSAYKEFLRNYTLDTGYAETPRFCLGYVDEDDIPELFVIEGTSHANCVKMYTYLNNGVVEIGSFGSYGSMSYAPKCNRFLSSNSGMGLVTDYFYYLESGQAWIYCEFEAYTDENFNTEYTVGGMWSDEVEYTAELEAVKTELGVDFVEVDYDTAYEINEGNIESIQ
jgi:hypothetical protein